MFSLQALYIKLFQPPMPIFRLSDAQGLPEKCFWKPEENSVRPFILSRLEAFTEVAEKYNKLSHLSFMAEQVLRELKTR